MFFSYSMTNLLSTDKAINIVFHFLLATSRSIFPSNLLLYNPSLLHSLLPIPSLSSFPITGWDGHQGWVLYIYLQTFVLKNYTAY